ncbi:TIR domain-containing protein [Teredinibacter turnerae]|uniref:TIR domain-containing protein n=1 Tax=Teredinibacter turnerae TaxID=2426 RepID=UPI0003A9AB06|nr:TIR domain-containing protein [Teredinibacter turnerae]
MKVFLSWSGPRSHRVAMIFRDWLPSVIQEITPYVSSEDIDKGARWSTDIAKELEDSTFGILCVTRENINAPWLTFEAGALSKTMDKSFVSPFLFDIKRSEVDGPILQFQSTIFEKEDVQKLIKTLNKACGENGLSDERLNKAFAVWYPTLESELNDLKAQAIPDDEPAKPEIAGAPDAHEILEEVLEISRANQKLIRNPDGSFGAQLDEMRQILKEVIHRMERPDILRSRRGKKLHPMMFEEIMHSSAMGENGHIGFQMTLAFLRTDFPWIYDAGMEALKIIKSRASISDKHSAMREFHRILDFSFDHPLMREQMESSKEMHIISREMPRMLIHSLERLIEG